LTVAKKLPSLSPRLPPLPPQLLLPLPPPLPLQTAPRSPSSNKPESKSVLGRNSC
jgi:hypothetical protein